MNTLLEDNRRSNLGNQISVSHAAQRAIASVEAAGGRVLGVLAVVDREEGGRAALEQSGKDVVALVRAGELGLK